MSGKALPWKAMDFPNFGVQRWCGMYEFTNFVFVLWWTSLYFLFWAAVQATASCVDRWARPMDIDRTLQQRQSVKANFLPEYILTSFLTNVGLTSFIAQHFPHTLGILWLVELTRLALSPSLKIQRLENPFVESMHQSPTFELPS